MATWARGVDFKNSNNTKRIGGIGAFGKDSTYENIYIGWGENPWNNTTSLIISSSELKYKNNKIYHAGNKPTPADIGAATSSHTHNYLSSSGGTISGDLNTSGNIITHNGTNACRYNLMRTASSGTRTGETWMTEILTTGRGTSYIGNRISTSSAGDNGTSQSTRVAHIQFDYDDIIMGAKVSVKPYDPNGQTLGTSSYPWKEVYCTRGAFNGSDIRLKENIKVINSINTLNEEKTTLDNLITKEDLYNYVKNSNIYSFNYKNSEEDMLGIIADDIPKNIFNKIGIINKNKDNDDELMSDIKMINGPSQIALLQGVLSQVINKLEYQELIIQQLTEEIKQLRS